MQCKCNVIIMQVIKYSDFKYSDFKYQSNQIFNFRQRFKN